MTQQPPGGQYPGQPGQPGHPGQQPQQQYQQPPQQQYQQPPQQQYQQAAPAQAAPVQAVPAQVFGGGGHDPKAMTALGPKGQDLLQNVTLLPNEKIKYAIMADGYFLGANPLLKMIAMFQAMITTLTGGHIRVFLIVTNQRVLLLQSNQVWCGVGRVRNVNAIALASLIETGCGKETQMCCVHSRYVHIETKTQKHMMMIKKLGDAQIQDFVANLSAVLVANVERGTAV